MSWARVDDGWWCHPKVMGQSLAAKGLWISALSWSCQQRRPVVPQGFVAMMGATSEDVDELVAAGVWLAVDGGWEIHNWADYQEKSLSEKRADAGRKGGVASTGSHQNDTTDASFEQQTTSKPQANGQANAEQDDKQESRPDPTRIDNQQTPSAEPMKCATTKVDSVGKPKYPPQFEDWWRIYPRKAGKGDALKAWRSAVKDIPTDELVEQTEAWAQATERCGTEERFLPFPATWLRASRWDDPLPEPATNGHDKNSMFVNADGVDQSWMPWNQ